MVIVKQQLPLLENVLKMLNAQAGQNCHQMVQRNVLKLTVQMLLTVRTGLVWMVNATPLVHAQITLKSKPLPQIDVPKRLAHLFKNLRPMVHAKTVLNIKSLQTMVNHALTQVALINNSIPQMVCAMIPHAQSTTNQIALPPQNALRRPMHVLVNLINQR